MRGALANAAAGEESDTVRCRVIAARERQLGRAGCINSVLGGSSIQSHCRLAPGDQELLGTAMEYLGLSARAYYRRILRVA